MPDAMQDMLHYFATQRDPVLRLLLAAALGGLIGLEREHSGKPAGFRTNLLICLGAGLITELSMTISRDVTLPGGFRSDPGRIAAQIVSGIGFLGAGTIMHARGMVTGLTTAATLWVVAAVGMAAGAGLYTHAVVGTLLVLLALMILGRFEDHLLPRRRSDRTVVVGLDARPELITEMEQLLTRSGFQVVAIDVDRTDSEYSACFTTRGAAADMDDVVSRLLAHAGVRRVSMH